jgi:FtsP/CotA-like multicopper oxidase with cupredoxin domain
MSTSRRTFLQRAAAVGAAALAGHSFLPASLKASARAAGGPLVIASGNGLAAVAKAMEIIQQGSDALDGVIAGVNIN